MKFIHNHTKITIEAYQITQVLTTNDSYSLSLPEASKIVGYWKTQTNGYVPRLGDYYIDMGMISASLVVSAADFANDYTGI